MKTPVISAEKCLLSIAIVLFNLYFSSAQDKIFIEAKPNKVTLFTMGASLVQTGNISLKQGTNAIIFTNVSSKMDVNKIRLQFQGSAKLVSLNVSTLKLEDLEKDLDYRIVIDSLKLLYSKIQLSTDILDVYTKEKELFSQNISIGGQSNGVQSAELQKTAELFRNKLSELVQLIRKEQSILTELINEKNILQTKKSKLEISFYKSNKWIQATVESDQNIKEDFELKYFVNDCGWAPYYDLNLADISKPIQLLYNAKIYNNTGIDWRNILLTISTTDPSKSAIVPDLNIWRLDFDSEDYFSERKKDWSKKGKTKSEKGYNLYDSAYNSTRNTTTIQVSQLSVDFEILEKKYILSNSIPYTVEMKSIIIPANYNYQAVPKLDNKAFLIAKITDWDTMNHIEGPANIYMNRVFIGESYINPNGTEDTLEISLGRDQRVAMKYEKKKDKSYKSFSGGSTIYSYSFEISIRNGNTKDISIDLYDQIPVSADNEIVVNADNISKAEMNKDNGKLNWNINVKAGESVKYLVSYSVKFPKNRYVSISYGRPRMLTCPDF